MIDFPALFSAGEYPGDAPAKAFRQKRTHEGRPQQVYWSEWKPDWEQRTYVYTPISDEKAQRDAQRRARAKNAAFYRSRAFNPPVRR
jgi:hypothetical protein